MTEAVTVDPTVLAPEIEEELEHYKQEVALLEERAKQLTVTDDLSESVALEFIAGAKRFYGEMEEKRDKRVRPFNTEVKRINDAYRPYTTVLDRLWRATDQARNAYMTKKQLAIEAENRRRIAEADELKRQEAARAEAARQEAERLRLEAERLEREEFDRILQAEKDRLRAEQEKKDREQAIIDAKRAGDDEAAKLQAEALKRHEEEEAARVQKAEEDRLAAIAEQNRLEKAAIKQDAKADIAETKATMVAPEIQVNESVGTHTLLDGSTVGTRQVDDWRFDNGAPIYVDPVTRKKLVDYYADDPKMAGVEIPKSCLLVDLTKLGKIVKAGIPLKGCTKFKRAATTAERK